MMVGGRPDLPGADGPTGRCASKMPAANAMPDASAAEAPPASLGAVLHDLARHPLRWLIRQWNWKAALLSTLARASIFFAVNLTVGWASAVNAAVTEVLYRALMTGTLASVSQAFRRVEPAWQGSLLIMFALPACAHGVEFMMHSWRGTERLYASVSVSILFSVASCVVSYWLHRRNVLIVGAGARPLLTDIVELPRVVVDVLVRGPLLRLRSAAARRG